MSAQHNKYLDGRMTYLLVLVFCLYALLVCCACYMVLRDEVDFGVVANTQSELTWRVSD